MLTFSDCCWQADLLDLLREEGGLDNLGPMEVAKLVSMIVATQSCKRIRRMHYEGAWWVTVRPKRQRRA